MVNIREVGPTHDIERRRRGGEIFRCSRVRVLGRDVLLQMWVVTRQFDKWVITMHACIFFIPLISKIVTIPADAGCAVAPGVGLMCCPASRK